VLSAIRSRAVHVADEMRAAGEEPAAPAVCDADALVALVTGDERRATFAGTEGGRARRPGVVYHVHLESLRRGEVRPGELCEVPGVGPVPIRVLTGLLGDATARLVIRDGVDVTTVAHLGRTVPAPVETALEARDPTCVVPNCTVALSLEIDHWRIPFAEGGPSELWNLCRLCRFHHRLKTYDGFRLVGGPGNWEWLPPD
ncbi:MAG: HNH endonuclease, partial [Acidobacteriota bacterium]|nr:HNH endonuclease [Acidobacteriota bacterium]